MNKNRRHSRKCSATEQGFFGSRPQLKSYAVSTTVSASDIDILIINEENAPALTDIYYNGTELQRSRIRRYYGLPDQDVDGKFDDSVNEQCKEYLRFKGIDW